MRFTTLIEWGRCGFGYSSDLLPELRLGLVRIAWCRGSIVERISGLRQSLRDALAEIRTRGA